MRYWWTYNFLVNNFIWYFQTKKMPRNCNQAFQCTPEWNNWHWLKVQGVIRAFIFSFWRKACFYGCQIRQPFLRKFYCAKSVQILSFLWSAFSLIFSIHSKYGKIRNRKKNPYLNSSLTQSFFSTNMLNSNR